MHIYSPTIPSTGGIFCTFFVMCRCCFCCQTISAFLKLLNGQCFLMLKGYNAASWFGVRLTSPDSLRVRFCNVDKIILKYKIMFIGKFLKHIKKKYIYIPT